MSICNAAGFFGFCLYFYLVLWAYGSVQDALLNAPPTEVANLSTGTACQEAAKLYASAFNVTGQEAIDGLSAALCLAGRSPISAIPAITVVERFVHRDGHCGGANCSPKCADYWQRRIARLLGGSLLSGEAIQNLTADSRTGDSCEIIEPWNFWNRFWGIFRKPSPISAPGVAQWLLGLKQCVGDQRDSCVLVTRLLQSALDNDSVRSSRTAVNMICGFERLLVFVLFFFMLLALSYRSIARLNLNKQKEKTIGALKETLPSPADALTWFEKEFPAKDDNTEFTPIRNLLKAAGRSLDDIDLRARIDSELISQSRVLLDTLITVFPVIGFAATLWGLIVALSSANLIASSVGDERNANVMRVTSELSSCFSTTLLALLSMTLFAVWSSLQAKREAALVTDTQECCLSIFRSRASREN
ncbi:hypothetical protein [Bradyrhizobium sp. USDA 4469]